MRRMVLAAAALLALVSTAGAQLSMPGRTITLVVTVAAGGGTDARYLPCISHAILVQVTSQYRHSLKRTNSHYYLELRLVQARLHVASSLLKR